MNKTKVLFAYCHELKRCVSIDEARFEYFSLDPDERKRFTFSCSDRSCNVLISGVNYHIMAEYGVKFKAAHYRSPHSHLPTCEWIQFTNEAENIQYEDGAENDLHEREARIKLRDIVNYFIPYTDTENSERDSEKDSTNLIVHSHPQNKETNLKRRKRFQRYTRTNQLQRLTDTWQEAKIKLTYHEFKTLKLTVANYGRIPLSQYITHIKQGLSNQYNGVIYGGGSLKKRYGRGFLFQFYDQYNNKNVFLYVSKDIMNKSRFGHYIDEVLKIENVRYFRIFLLNPVVSERADGKGKISVNLNISDLRQLVVYYELKTNTSEESELEDKATDNCA